VLLDKAFKEQIEHRRTALLDLPVSNLEEMAAFNQQKGIVMGLMLAIAIPHSMLAEAVESWEKKLEEHRNEHGS
jgi:hypothetical protein